VGEPPATDGHYSGASVRALLNIAEAALGADALPALCRRAGETRPIPTLVDPGTWSDYGQFRRLAEAVAEGVGGVDHFDIVPFSSWQASPGLADDVQVLSSLDALLERIGSLSARYQRVTTMSSEKVRDGEWLVHQRYHEGMQPYPAHCAFARGLLAQAPFVFGLPAADVVEETCQARGDHRCTTRVTLATSESNPEIRAALQSRVLRARLHSIQETIGDLVSGQSIDAVLDCIVAAAARAVLARGFVLSVVEPSSGRAHVRSEGLTESEAHECDRALRRGGLPEQWTVVPVSGADCYGNLAAIRVASGVRADDRRVLEAYARVAAAAIESAAALDRASRQAEVATTLLQLSRALARLGSVDEVASRVAHAAPRVLDCDAVVVGLLESEETARIVAAYGFGPESDRAKHDRVVPVNDLRRGNDMFQILVRGGALTPQQEQKLGTAAALVAVQLHAGGTVIGWLGVIVNDRPERLIGQPDLEDRVRGLASMAGTALHNAQLLEAIAFQADHDPLTGLANFRLFRAQAEQTLARARREGDEVAVLFLDLDRFKEVNDRLGHADGDRLLRQVALRLRVFLRESDSLARVGGDEFVVLLPGARDGGATVVEKLGEVMREPFPLGAGVLEVAVSTGVARFGPDGDDIDALLRVADMRMYQQKQTKRKAAVRV